jgi:hypothetical protein
MSTTIENQLQEINQIVAQGNLSTLNYTQGGPATGSRTSSKRCFIFLPKFVENGEIRKKSQKNLMRLSGVKQVY